MSLNRHVKWYKPHNFFRQISFVYKRVTWYKIRLNSDISLKQQEFKSNCLCVYVCVCVCACARVCVSLKVKTCVILFPYGKSYLVTNTYARWQLLRKAPYKNESWEKNISVSIEASTCPMPIKFSTKKLKLSFHQPTFQTYFMVTVCTFSYAVIL